MVAPLSSWATVGAVDQASGRAGLSLAAAKSRRSAILGDHATDPDRVENFSQAPSEGTSAGESLGGLSGVPLAQGTSAHHSAMALQEDQLEAIAQKVVARLQASEAAQSGKKVRDKGLRHRRPTPISSSSSDSEPVSLKKSKHWNKAPKSHRSAVRPAVRCKLGCKKAVSPDPWTSDTSSSSEGFSEEGELSGSEQDFLESSKCRFFLLELFPKLMSKVIKTLGLISQDTAEPDSKNSMSKPSKFFPQASSGKFPSVPMPASFKLLRLSGRTPPGPRGF